MYNFKYNMTFIPNKISVNVHLGAFSDAGKPRKKKALKKDMMVFSPDVDDPDNAGVSSTFTGV